MIEQIARLAEMIEEIIIEAEDEPHFTTREHAATGAEEICRDLIMPVLADAWDEGRAAQAVHEAFVRLAERESTTPPKPQPNPYRQETDS